MVRYFLLILSWTGYAESYADSANSSSSFFKKSKMQNVFVSSVFITVFLFFKLGVYLLHRFHYWFLYTLCRFLIGLSITSNIICKLFQLCCYWDQRWNNDDPTLKMKQNLTTLQRWYNVSARRWNKVETTSHNVETTLHNIGLTLIQRCFNLASTLVKTILNPIGLVMIMDLQIHE